MGVQRHNHLARYYESRMEITSTTGASRFRQEPSSIPALRASAQDGKSSVLEDGYRAASAASQLMWDTLSDVSALQRVYRQAVTALEARKAAKDYMPERPASWLVDTSGPTATAPAAAVAPAAPEPVAPPPPPPPTTGNGNNGSGNGNGYGRNR
jgi:hypothetical protein